MDFGHDKSNNKSAISSNIFYRNAIKNCDLPIIHALGDLDKKETVFTRYEFEFMLNCLHDFLNKDII